MLDEFFECENTLKNDPGFQEALRKRGITDCSLLMVDPWSAGYYGEAEEGTLRLAGLPMGAHRSQRQRLRPPGRGLAGSR